MIPFVTACLSIDIHTQRRQDGDPLLCKYGIPKQLKIEGTVGKTASEESAARYQVMVVGNNFSGLFNLQGE